MSLFNTAADDLRTALASLTTERDTLQASLDTALTDLTASQTAHTDISSQLSEALIKVTGLEASVAALPAQIEEAASAKAIALIAATGTSPIAVKELASGTEASDGPKTFADFIAGHSKLAGAEAAEYFAKHSAAFIK